jgi:tRNA pseudouridine38-40 synthase
MARVGRRGAPHPPPEAGRDAPTFKLLLEYEGTRYRGFQVQKNARTVCGELLRALTEAGAPVVELQGAGRTDAGVHALAQCAHLRLAAAQSPEGLRRAVNGLLPADIHVLRLEPASPRFHARHDATARSYLYQVSRRRTALFKPFVWWVREELDLPAMAEAAALFRGFHDFVRFCRRVQEAGDTRVAVESVELVPRGALVLVRVTASHFLWGQVRRMVGALVAVGTGAWTLPELAALLHGDLPSRIGDPGRWSAPASGLFLERVRYPGDGPLPPPQPVTPLP